MIETATPSPAMPAGRAPSVLVLAPFAAGAGLLCSLAYAPASLWPAAFVAVFILARIVTLASGVRAAAVLGLVYGLAFNLVTLSWQSAVEVASYLGLAVVESLYACGLGALLRLVGGRPWTVWASAAVWVLVEAVQARFPFGGFEWTRLGYAMVDTPLAGLYPIVGAPAASFGVALLGQTAAWVWERRSRRRALTAVGAAASVFGLGALGTLWPGTPATASTIDVGWVQGGGGDAGFYGLGPAGSTGRRHADETKRLMDAVAAGRYPRPAFIVWPENGTDMDPFADAGTNALIANAVADAGVPILVGVPTSGPGPHERQTTALWWTNAGVTARYDKRNLVPFGEWIPFRDVLLPLFPDLQAIGDQGVPGTHPGALHVTGPDGRPLTVGISICFEVAFPETMFDAVDNGAEVMVMGSNNAMFMGTPQIEQQFAITRVRAAEMRRQILVVTVSGISGLIDDHGGVVWRGTDGTADSGVATMTRTTERTPEVEWGWAFEYLAAAGGAAGALGGRRPRRARQWKSAVRRTEERDDG